MGARSEAKAKEAIEKMKKEGLGPGNGEIEWLEVDLSEVGKARKAAERMLKKGEKVDYLSTLLPSSLG